MASIVDLVAPTRPKPPSKDRRRSLTRWLLIGVVSLLIHLALLDALPHWTIEPGDEPVDNEPLRATLMPAITPPEPVPQPVAPTPAPPKPTARPKTAPRPIATDPFVPESFDPVPELRVGPAPPPAPPAPIPTEPPAVTTPPAAVPPPAPAPAAAAPQSARLSYKVVYIDAKNFNAVHYYGFGTIDWSIDGGHYRSDLTAAVDFLLFKVNVLASHSEGSVSTSGLSPDRYTESPRKRATVATNFNRDARQSITFSASQASVPLMTGVQDRLSVLFQIGALLLANTMETTTDPAAVGNRIEIPVAGVRGDVETWTFEGKGDETLETGAGSLATTHLQRIARPGTNDRAIDIWIAAKDGGYPARVLYTETNGSTIEMTIKDIGATHVAAPPP